MSGWQNGLLGILTLRERYKYYIASNRQERAHICMHLMSQSRETSHQKESEINCKNVAISSILSIPIFLLSVMHRRRGIEYDK